MVSWYERKTKDCARSRTNINLGIFVCSLDVAKLHNQSPPLTMDQWVAKFFKAWGPADFSMESYFFNCTKRLFSRSLEWANKIRHKLFWSLKPIYSFLHSELQIWTINLFKNLVQNISSHRLSSIFIFFFSSYRVNSYVWIFENGLKELQP